MAAMLATDQKLGGYSQEPIISAGVKEALEHGFT